MHIILILSLTVFEASYKKSHKLQANKVFYVGDVSKSKRAIFYGVFFRAGSYSPFTKLTDNF